MELAGILLLDSTWTLYTLIQESLKLKSGNCSVYVDTRDIDVTIKLPAAATNVGAFIFIYLNGTSGGEIVISPASGDYIAKGGAPVTTAGLNAQGEYILLYSSGLYWHECVSNGVA